MDSFVCCALSGKHVLSTKRLDVDVNVLSKAVPRLNEALARFHHDPFSSLNATCIKTLLVEYCNVEDQFIMPSYQSARLALNVAETLLKHAIVVTGDQETSNVAEKFFNFASVFINSQIHNKNKLWS